MFKNALDDPPPRVPSINEPFTPTLPGYLAMLGLVFVVFGLVVGATMTVSELSGPDDGSLGGVLDVLVLGLICTGMVAAFGVLFGGVPAILGIVIVHVLCRRVRAQWVHVVAFGVAGVVLSGPPLIWLTDPELVFHPLQAFAGGCAALVRLAVTPWVPYVREGRETRAAHGR